MRKADRTTAAKVPAIQGQASSSFILHSPFCILHSSFIKSAKASFATGIVMERLMQGFAVEVRPALFRHPQLGIRNLPKKKIAYAHLAGRTNQQVGFGHACRV